MTDLFSVKPMSYFDIEMQAIQLLKEHATIHDYLTEHPQIVDVLSLSDTVRRIAGFALVVLPDDDPSFCGVLAYTDLVDKTIVIRSSDYDLLDGTAKGSSHRAKTTLCHEIGHACCHGDQIESFSMQGIAARQETIGCDSPEWQAFSLGRALQMPFFPFANLIYNNQGLSRENLIDVIATAFDVSSKLAELRLAKYHYIKGEQEKKLYDYMTQN